MRYIIIDDYNDTINIVCKDDGSGEPLIYEHLKDAIDNLEEVAQDGIVVPLINIVDLLNRCGAFIDNIKGILIDDNNEKIDDINLESDLAECLL